MILFMWLDLFTRMYYMYFCTHLLLYADDLAVIAETEEELIRRLNEWKDNVESKGARTLTRINSYEYTHVSSYESKTAEVAWCKLHWHEFIRVNRVVLVRVNRSPKHALANDFIRTNWHRVPQIIMSKVQNLSTFSRKQWLQQTKSWFRLLWIKKSL